MLSYRLYASRPSIPRQDWSRFRFTGKIIVSLRVQASAISSLGAAARIFKTSVSAESATASAPKRMSGNKRIEMFLTFSIVASKTSGLQKTEGWF